eukprot:UN10219
MTVRTIQNDYFDDIRHIWKHIWNHPSSKMFLRLDFQTLLPECP